MHIWVDADACPVVIKEILFKAVARTGIKMTLVANRGMRIPPSKDIDFILVASGLDVADNEIVARMRDNDLVITADIPLAAEVVAKGGIAINSRGEKYTAENIRSRLSSRDFMEDLRASGVETGGPAPFNAKDKQKFANSLDQILMKHLSTKKS